MSYIVSVNNNYYYQYNFSCLQAFTQADQSLFQKHGKASSKHERFNFFHFCKILFVSSEVSDWTKLIFD